jgi:acetyltransferase-like isoleucine patch superfamily enzyme
MSGSSIVAREHIVIERNVFIGANCVVVDSYMHLIDSEERISMRSAGIATAPVRLEEKVWLGMNVVVLKSVTLGRNTVVGAGAVVSRSLPPNVIAAGNSAKIIKMLNALSWSCW